MRVPTDRVTGFPERQSASWTTTKLRYLLKVNPAPSTELRSQGERAVPFIPMEALSEDGSLDQTLERPVKEVLTGYSYFENGDVIMAKVTPCFENGKAALVHGLSEGGFGSTEITTLRAREGLAPGFLYYIVRSDHFRQASIASMLGAGGLKRVPDELIRSFSTPVPPEATQREVVDFLDRETAKIDALISKQEQLIASLREDRAATITEAVTKGLDSSVEMRDSGVPWMGKVPAHWAVDRIKHSIAFARNGIWGAEPDGGRDDIRCIRVADFDRPHLAIDDRDMTFRKVTHSEREGRILQRGDLLLEKSGGGEKSPVGFVVLYDRDEPAVCSNFVARISLAPMQDPKFWTYVHHSLYQSRMTYPSIKQNTGIQNLDQQSYFNERVGFPPLEEQREIAGFLDAHCIRIDALIEKSTQMIETLCKYRSALITNAVTGKIDVRETV
ncbi:restriction endonuclease subunit S [Gordonia paraffinivorans]|uniref:restriction endonuclease subunit S n=1 Tax=Gordonia paraffinivorans TaxID=175628 RepID=UPI0014470EB8|nr:restriction endonuclease subunit S [Gordonia paraffinivorans]